VSAAALPSDLCSRRLSPQAQRRQLKGPRRGVLLMIASAAFWASGTLLSKAVLNDTDFDPLPLLTVQLATSVAALGLVVVVQQRSTKGTWRFGWTGLLEPGAAYGLSIVGLARTSAANATILGSLEPVIVPLFSWLILRHRPRAQQLILTGLATLGAVVVSATGSATRTDLAGDALIVGGVLAAAMYVVFSSRHLTDAHPVVLAAVQQTWALGLTVTITVLVGVAASLTWSGTWLDYGFAGASGVCLYAIPFSLYLHALQHLHVSAAAGYLCLIPVFGVAGAYLALNEPFQARQLVGAGVVVGALYGSALLDRRNLVDRRPSF
jgi:drug/metabolite transporter (DMT)-like permease